jgi:predicted dehydrogenase
MTGASHRIAVIGLGLRIARVLIAMKAVGWKFEVRGYADRSPAGLEWLQGDGIAPGQAFDTAEELLSAGPFDLVLIGSPNHLHLRHLKLALEAGYPIFCEKPIVRTAEETIEIARILGKADKALPPIFIGLVLRSMPLVREFVRHASRGDIGQLVSMDATEHLVPDHGGYIARNWRRRVEWAGSFMLDKACHDFDIFGLVAKSRAARVAGLGGRNIFVPERAATAARTYSDGRPAYELAAGGWESATDAFASDMDISDNQVAIVEYENGFRLCFHCNTHSALPERRWYLVGTEGTLLADLVTNTLTFRRSLDVSSAETVTCGEIDMLSHNGADFSMAKDLLAALSGKVPFPVTPWESMEAGLTVMAIDQASATQHTVNCAPMWSALDEARGLKVDA